MHPVDPHALRRPEPVFTHQQRNFIVQVQAPMGHGSTELDAVVGVDYATEPDRTVVSVFNRNRLVDYSQAFERCAVAAADARTTTRDMGDWLMRVSALGREVAWQHGQRIRVTAIRAAIRKDIQEKFRAMMAERFPEEG